MKEKELILPSWDNVKKHTFLEIKNFYDEISKFPQEILDQIVFYGGTIIYISAGVKDVNRFFGDLDVVVPSNKLNMVREYMQSTGKLIIQYDGKKEAEKYKIDSADGVNDFGFKGILFGIKLSVHPITMTNDGEIITKWIKIKDGKIELLANCTMLESSNIEEMLTKIDYNSKKLTIIKPEINLGWKMRRSEGHDEEDINFMYSHKEKLKINEEEVKRFREKMPDYDVSIAYKIEDGNIKILEKGCYEDF